MTLSLNISLFLHLNGIKNNSDIGINKKMVKNGIINLVKDVNFEKNFEFFLKYKICNIKHINRIITTAKITKNTIIKLL